MQNNNGNNTTTPDEFDPEDGATELPELDGEEIEASEEIEEERNQTEWTFVRENEQKKELEEVKGLEDAAIDAEKEMDTAGRINDPKSTTTYAENLDKNMRAILETKLKVEIKKVYDAEVAKNKTEQVAVQIAKEGRMHQLYQALRFVKLMDYFKPIEPVIDNTKVTQTAFENFSDDVRKDVEARKEKAKTYSDDKELQERICDDYRNKSVKLLAAYTNIDKKMKKVSEEIANLEKSKSGLEKKLKMDPSEENQQYLDDCKAKLTDKKHIYSKLQRVKDDREEKMYFAVDGYEAAKATRELSRGVSTKVRKTAQDVAIAYNRLIHLHNMKEKIASYGTAVADIAAGDKLAEAVMSICQPFFDGLDDLFKQFLAKGNGSSIPPLSLSNVKKYNQSNHANQSTAYDTLNRLVEES